MSTNSVVAAGAATTAMSNAGGSTVTAGWEDQVVMTAYHQHYRSLVRQAALLVRDIPTLEEVYQVPVPGIVVNSTLPEGERERSEFWKTRWAMQSKYLDLTYRNFPNKVIARVPLLETEALGVEKLRRIGATLYEETEKVLA